MRVSALSVKAARRMDARAQAARRRSVAALSISAMQVSLKTQELRAKGIMRHSGCILSTLHRTGVEVHFSGSWQPGHEA